MQEVENFFYKNYQKNSEHKIIQLFKKTFKTNFILKKWIWIFKKNPNGKNKITLVFSKKKLISHCASIKISFKYNSKIKFFYRVQNFMVDKEYRKKKIASETLKSLISKITKNNGYVITFPIRDITKKIFSKKNFRKLFHICTYEMLLKKNYKVEKKLILKNSTKVKIENKDMKLINGCLNKYPIYNLRSKNYLNWRYNFNYASYKITRIFSNNEMIGLLIGKFYQQDKSICVCELFLKKNTNMNLKSLIESAVLNFKRNRPRKIKIWSMSYFSFHKDLLNLGFKNSKFKTNVCTYKNLSKNKSIKKMYLSMGNYENL